MSVPQIKVKVQRRPQVKLKVLPKFPASLTVASPLELDRTGGNYALSLDVNDLLTSTTPVYDARYQRIWTFDTLAAATASKIDAEVDIVETLEREAGKGGGWRYSRIATTTAAAWRWTSADGQMWSAINRPGISPEVFAAFDGEDCTAALQSMATWLELVGAGLGGATIEGDPSAGYEIWPAGTTPAVVMDLESVRNVTFRNIKFTTDNLFVPQGSPQVFLMHGVNGLSWDNVELEHTALTTLESAKGGTLFYFYDTAGLVSSRIRINNWKQTGGRSGLSVVGPLRRFVEAHDIVVSNADFYRVYYPLSFQFAGDGFHGFNINCDDCGRPYFPYGASNHFVHIAANGGGTFNQVLLHQYAYPTTTPERNGLSNINVWYKNKGRVDNTTSQSLVSLAFSQGVAKPVVSGAADNGSGEIRLTVDSTANMATGQTWWADAVGGVPNATGKWPVTVISATEVDLDGSTWGGTYTSGGHMAVPAFMRGVKIHLDVEADANEQPRAVLTGKSTTTGFDTTSCGYEMDVEIGGSIRKWDYGIPALDLFGAGSGGFADPYGEWGGDEVRLNLRNLEITGTDSSVLIDATDLTRVILDNVRSPSTVPWTVTDPSSVVRPTNVTATGVLDHLAVIPGVAPATHFLKSVNVVGGLTSAQPAFSDISGTATAAQGGTGQSSYAVGDLLYASTTTALSKLVDVATGNALLSGGVGVAPAYGKIGLATHVTGTLPIANGGTGVTTGAVVSVKKQIFTADGTYTPSAGMLYCIIECVGSGGSGAGGTGPTTGFFVGGGGGSGSYSRKYATAGDVGASQVVTVGAGGTAPAAGNTNGGVGGNVSVGGLCIARGGNGGNYASTGQIGSGGSGGAPHTGDFTISGNAGSSGIWTTSTGILFSSGAGGSSFFAGGAAAVGQGGSGSTSTGSAGGNYGGGGSGGNARDTTNTFAGGNGGRGVVVITEFCSQ